MLLLYVRGIWEKKKKKVYSYNFRLSPLMYSERTCGIRMMIELGILTRTWIWIVMSRRMKITILIQEEYQQIEKRTKLRAMRMKMIRNHNQQQKEAYKKPHKKNENKILKTLTWNKAKMRQRWQNGIKEKKDFAIKEVDKNIQRRKTREQKWWKSVGIKQL